MRRLLHHLILLGQFSRASANWFFFSFLLLAWIMSKIERRNVGVYGLPLRRSVISGFIRGYFLWGFLPLAILLSILRALHVFYFGNLSLLNLQVLGWGALWFFFFLLVGFFKEYSFRGYFLCRC